MDARMERAIQAAEEGDTHEARGLLRQVLQADPDNEDAWLLMANTASDERDRRVALRQVLRIDPDNQAAWEMLAGTGVPAPPPPITADAADEAAEGEIAEQPAPEGGSEEPASEEDSEAAAMAAAAAAGVAAAAVTDGAAGHDATPGVVTEDEERAPTPPPEPEPLEPLPAPPRDAPAPPPAYEPWDDGEPRPWLPLLIAIVVVACIVVTLTAGVLYAPKFRAEAGPTATLALVGPTPPESEVAVDVSTDDAVPAPGAEELSEPPADRAEGAFSTDPQAPLPDLVVKWVKIEMETGADCMETGAELGTTVNVYNAGDDSAAPFALDVNGTLVDVPTGLAAGEQTFVWVAGYTSGAETQVQVDAASEVEESDEGNNVYGQFVPIPTPLPTCTPPPETKPSEAEVRAPGAFDLPPISVANAASLAPVRITTRSDYSDGPTSFLQFELDEQGNIRLAVDTPDGLEEWLVIDGVTYAGEASAEGLTPYQAVDQPQDVVGFADFFDLFAPRGDADRFATAFPLPAVLWWGTPERTERQGTEPIHGLDAEEYTITVKPEGAPQEAYVGQDRSEDLAAAVSAGEGAPVVTLWVEPESGAILQAEWNVDLPSGTRAQYRLDVAPVGVGPFALPSADMPNPAAQHCTDEGYETEIRSEAGGEVGYCVFADGNACEEWAFYRGDCTPEDAQPMAEATAETAATETPIAAEEGTPQQAATAYWEHVGAGEFEKAWALLSPTFRKRYYSNKFKSYAQFQKGRKICGIVVTEATKGSGGADEATVTVRLTVRKGSACNEQAWVYRHRMVLDDDQGAWLTADATRLN